MRQRALRNILLVGAALSTLAAPALADSYFFRSKPDVSVPAQAFSFAPQADQNPGATVTSAVAPVKGYKGKSISVSGDAGAAYQVCSAADCSDQGSTWRTAATSGLPESFYARARVTASATFLGTATATVTVGGVQSPFATTTRAKDEAPDVISFASKTGVAGGTVDSDIVQVKNHEGVTVSVTGTTASFRVCADATCSGAPTFDATSKAASNNSWLQLRQVAPAAGQPGQVATLRYGALNGSPLEVGWSVVGTTGPSAGVLSIAANTCTSGWKEAFSFAPGSLKTPATVDAALRGKRYLVSFKQATSGKTFNYFSSHASATDWCGNNHSTKFVRMVDSGGYDSGNRGERDCATNGYGWYLGNVDLSLWDSWTSGLGVAMGRISTRPSNYESYQHMLADGSAAYFRVAPGSGWDGSKFAKMATGDEASVYTCQ